MRERGRERKRERGRERKRGREGERERLIHNGQCQNRTSN
jgi:hypothetical protein